ncbi:uncharacterized protein At5g48480-like [Citrus clementina]|uniref:uncharacterized protein At5g48480-like n=1 Tax=Citrus clementina TaxID=85681 RepID=UPI000CED5730|nr:uncharacterized protein At5g48480-like [Citrus x clementina]
MAAPATSANFMGMKPQLLVEASKATNAIQFYKTTFGAVEISRSMETKRKSEQDLNSRLPAPHFLSLDFFDDCSAVKNMGIGCVLCLEIDDVEATLAKAVSVGVAAEGKLAKGNSVGCSGRLGAWERSRILVISHGSFALWSRSALTWKLESGLI